MAPKETSAPRLVREGNRLLLNEKPAEALEAYQKAETLKPDAREIAFGEGLAHYRLGEYDKARDAFNRAGGGAADVLADDALYSLGTCDHAEALGAEDPKVAMSKLESAMRSYQSVLADQSDHPAAKDANLKAASYWRQLKQQMQQQQQQQQNSDQKNDEQKDEQQQQNQQQQQDQEKQEQQEQKQQQEQQQENQQKNEQDQKQGEKEQQQSSEAKEDDKQQDEPKQAQQEKEENVSREQAERKLRELMQDLRDRNKRRREEVKSPPYRPTEKDW